MHDFTAARCERLERQVKELAAFSDSAVGVTRLTFSERYVDALKSLTALATSLGCQVHSDEAGNFHVTSAAAQHLGWTVAVGSHIDSVPMGGAYDGVAGVLCGFDILQSYPELPITVVIFAEEEGASFAGGLVGSRFASGKLTSVDLEQLLDGNGRSFAEGARWTREAVNVPQLVSTGTPHWRQYLEIHIEQGRVLQDGSARLGVVTDIVGLIQAELIFFGRADHAGTTPMTARSDAGVTAAQFIVDLEELVRQTGEKAVGTVGVLEFGPGAANVVPGRARLSLDLRDPDESNLRSLAERVKLHGQALAARRNQQFTYREELFSAPVPLDLSVVDGLGEAASQQGIQTQRMASGAGHDAMMMAGLVPAGMLFVPCLNGVSHSPEEWADVQDLVLAADTVAMYLHNAFDLTQ
ncbi:Zn-dependent hydrolase (plasmid) [Deinococcus psychrotolerans]|uniref:Zn-dependent hydrolase n=1 Tax=Deinococcus psychrotolerans TaxID=2489213 RepID=A0A3G8YI32_9DEIO|nr:M20 family metallo-hydrolase [Deinococcus psychrotolerans]AZI44949.1 Zn-dependent hydrolase [Deinococcus psychrotolerans]